MEVGKKYTYYIKGTNMIDSSIDNFDFVGKKISEVEQLYHLNFRIASKDGESYMLTCDFVPNRFNFHLQNGIITSFTKG